jgi:hypothetical protein
MKWPYHKEFSVIKRKYIVSCISLSMVVSELSSSSTLDFMSLCMEKNLLSFPQRLALPSIWILSLTTLTVSSTLHIYIYIYSLDKVGKTITLSCKSLFCCGSGMIDPSILFHLLSNSVSNLLLDLYDSYACEFY